MSRTTQFDPDRYSLVQAGKLFPLLPPQALLGTLERGKNGPKGAHSDTFEGIWVRDVTRLKVCLKRLRPVFPVTLNQDEANERFTKRVVRETWIWAQAKHENIFPFYGWMALEEETYLLSPWAKNGSLEQYLHKNQIPVVDKLKLLQGAARGLSYLHQFNPKIAHGDIKPGNILITNDLDAALCDFGVSRVMVECGRSGVTTGPGGAGTAGYRAPEILADDKTPTTPESDIYSMGGVILWAMSKKHPFYHLNQLKLSLAILKGETSLPENHPDLPENDPVWELLRKCWKQDPTDRLSARMVVEELGHLIEDNLQTDPEGTEDENQQTNDIDVDSQQYTRSDETDVNGEQVAPGYSNDVHPSAVVSLLDKVLAKVSDISLSGIEHKIPVAS